MLLATVSVGFLLYVATVVRHVGLFGPAQLFVYVQMIMALGTFPLLDAVRSDIIYGYIIAWSVLSFMATHAVVALHRPPQMRIGGRWVPELKPTTAFKPNASLIALIVLSAIIVVLYYRSVGYSALFVGLRNSLTGGSADIQGIRIAAYSGDRYFFPGYVNQFKNALLPALVVIVIYYWRSIGKQRVLASAGLILFTIFALLGTGQRGAFIQFVIVLIVFLYLVNQRRLPRNGLIIALASLMFILISTIALGRSNRKLSDDAGLAERLFVSLDEFIDRIFVVQQEAGIAGFRYIYARDVEWGGEWLQAALGMLPGVRGTDLPNRIFEVLYGTDRGTASPSVWGSVYHNWGILGILVLPVVFAVVFGLIGRACLLPIPRNSLTLMGIAGMTTTVGLWAAGTPVTLLNHGLVVYAFLWWWGTRVPTTGASSPDPEARRPSISLRS